MTKAEAIALGAHCWLCPLQKDGVIVPSSPPRGKHRLTIVGEGPSRAEEKLGRPFVGLSGKLLDNTLAEAGISRDECYVTNTALCRGEGDKENERAAECCTPRLLREVRGLTGDNTEKSAPILAIGKIAARALLGVRSILVARGFIWRAKEIEASHIKTALRKAHKTAQTTPNCSKKLEAILKAEILAGRGAIAGRVVLPMLHPAFILRADTWNPIFRLDMQRAARIMNGDIRREDEGEHKTGGPEVLRGLGRVVSCDIETDGIKPLETNILSVGVSDGKRTSVVWPWRPSYAKRVGKWLGSRSSVVFHNGWQFDLLVLRHQGVRW